MNPLLIASNITPTGSQSSGPGYGSGSDPYFKYVAALYHGQSTGPTNNKVFQDSSSSNYTMTVTGNPSQGSFSPYGKDFSYFFNGSTDYLTYAPGSGNAFGTGDFTVECWVNPTATIGSQYILDNRNATLGANGSWAFYFSSGQFSWFNGSTNYYVVGAQTPVGQWTHLAYCRASGTGRLFVNGTLQTATGDTTSYSASANISYVGCRYNQQTSPNTFFLGYISQLRITKSARYTASFTPPTSSFTVDSNTTLATAKANCFKDSGVNNYTMTQVGSPKVTRFNPFGNEDGVAYSTTSYGGSAYFNGSTDYMTSSTPVQFTGDFTMETWVYPISINSNGCMVAAQWIGGTATSCSFIWSISTNLTMSFNYGIGSTNSGFSSTNKVQMNAWNHIAVSRAGSTVRLFINGVVDPTTANISGTFNAGPVGTMLGYFQGSAYGSANSWLNGYMCDFRIVNGTSLYGSSFTPPSSPLTAITNTKLLVKMQNAGTYDNAMMSDAVMTGAASTTTAVTKFGSSALYFDGSSNATMQLPDSPQLNFLSNNFTVECWIYPIASTNSIGLFGKRTADTNYAQCEVQWSDTGLTCYATTASGSWPLQITATNVPTGAWSHFALVRNGSTFTIYINGTSSATGTLSGALYATTAPFNIGGSANSFTTGKAWNGYIQDFRITNGIARYTSNFSVPSAPYSDH
jgi:hypothetical protein